MRPNAGAWLLPLVAIAALAGSCFGRPPLAVRVAGQTVTLDIQTLGEYPTDVAHVQLRDARTGNVLWEQVRDTDQAQTRTITLSIGTNDVERAADVEHGSYRVIVPTDGRSFELQADVTYEIAIWGNDRGWSRIARKFVLRGRK